VHSHLVPGDSISNLAEDNSKQTYLAIRDILINGSHILPNCFDVLANRLDVLVNLLHSSLRPDDVLVNRLDLDLRPDSSLHLYTGSATVLLKSHE
jgi:hypothetical protein